MKRILPLVLCLTLLGGCGLSFSNEYLSVSEHNDPFAYKEETEPTDQTPEPMTASDYYTLRNTLYSSIMNGTESEQVYLIDYRGDLEKDLKTLAEYFTATDPMSAYATDYIEFDTVKEGGNQIINMHVVYRRSVSEIKAIRTVRGSEPAIALFKDALTQTQPSLTLQISGFSDEDLGELLYQFCTENPELFPEFPIISVSVFPESGNVRVVEAHFTYSSSADALISKRSLVKSLLDSAYYSVPSSVSEGDRIPLIISYLTGRFSSFTENPEASVYSLLENGIGNSRSFTAVVSDLCGRAEIDCLTVHGLKNDEAYDWCILCIDGQYRHVDVLSSVLKGEPVSFLTDDDMEGYEWNREAFPACGSSEDEQE